MKHHPDRQQSDADKETAYNIFAKIAAAYDCLTDPVKRYDWKQANPNPQNKNNKNKNSSSHSSDGHSTTSDPGPAKRKTSSARPRDYTPPPTHHRTTKPSPRPRPPARPNHNSQQLRKPPTNSRRATPSSSAYRGKPTSHNAREDPHAPNTTYRSTPHSKENMRTKQPRKNSKTNTNTTSYSSTPHSKENPHAPNTTYSGKPLHHNKEDPHAPNAAYSGKPKAKYAKDDLYGSRHSTNLSRSAPPPRRPNTGGPPTHTHKTTIPAPSPQKVPAPRKNTNKVSLHDPYQTFERILKQELPKEYRKGNWRPTLHNSKHATTMVIQASPAPAKHANAVMSMTTSTQTKPISGKGMEAKTITKIWRRGGSVEKVVQASMAATPHQAQRYLDAQGTTTIARPRR